MMIKMIAMLWENKHVLFQHNSDTEYNDRELLLDTTHYLPVHIK